MKIVKTLKEKVKELAFMESEDVRYLGMALLGLAGLLVLVGVTELLIWAGLIFVVGALLIRLVSEI